ncbi:unnamed protein product [Microthlaspi erraticum]|uniref:Protein LHCP TRANSLOCATION DEFECT n=1 Tax=Microthlaspi erraticum TaxID=1685480 RepID=A0A6D2J5P1_9BRAS|nr:unnamed protein product [Microthlaspi erraticum]
MHNSSASLFFSITKSITLPSKALLSVSWNSSSEAPDPIRTFQRVENHLLVQVRKERVDAENAGIYGSQSRDDFDKDDIEQCVNYMGMLAFEGTYDKMEALFNQNIHPVDIMLLLAASEGDKPKIEELLRSGADYTVKDAGGRTALDRASNDEIRDLILGSLTQKA